MWFRNLNRGLQLPLLVLPALVVTGASLYLLLSAVTSAAAASEPGDLLYALRQPALELRHTLTLNPEVRAEIELMMARPSSSSPLDADPLGDEPPSRSGETRSSIDGALDDSDSRAETPDIREASVGLAADGEQRRVGQARSGEDDLDDADDDEPNPDDGDVGEDARDDDDDGDNYNHGSDERDEHGERHNSDNDDDNSGHGSRDTSDDDDNGDHDNSDDYDDDHDDYEHDHDDDEDDHDDNDEDDHDDDDEDDHDDDDEDDEDDHDEDDEDDHDEDDD